LYKLTAFCKFCVMGSVRRWDIAILFAVDRFIERDVMNWFSRMSGRLFGNFDHVHLMCH
jgi:hypothetical protein